MNETLDPHYVLNALNWLFAFSAINFLLSVGLLVRIHRLKKQLK